jgi:hypothetical protein
MNGRNKMLKTCLVLSIFIILLVGNETTTNSQESQACHIVRIVQGQGQRVDSIALDPSPLTIKKGDCVVWINWSRFPDAILKFKEAQKCLEATSAPTGFKPEFIEGCYVTSMIPLGGTSSLRFIKPGTYGYLVQATPVKKIQAKGEILVR